MAKDYEKIAEDILKQIRHGRYNRGDRVPSEYDLARQFNVNKTTANKAIATLVATGYLSRRKGAGGTVVARQNAFPLGSIGVITPPPNTSYYLQVLEGARRRAFSCGYTITILDPNDALAGEDFWQMVEDSGLAGVIASHRRVPRRLNIPVMVIDDLFPGSEEFDQFNCDNFSGGKIIAEHLIEMGHREMVFGLQSSYRPTLRMRADGFCRGMEIAGMNSEGRVIDFDAREGGMLSFTEYVFKKFPKTTAIAFCTDYAAIGSIRYLQNRGLRVPQDISITGFGCVEEARVLDLRLTSIDQHPDQLAFRAIDALIQKIEGNSSTDEPLQEVEPVELRKGDSVAMRVI